MLNHVTLTQQQVLLIKTHSSVDLTNTFGLHCNTGQANSFEFDILKMIHTHPCNVKGEHYSIFRVSYSSIVTS